jgi:multiple sugar transport system ATP-binding protein
MSFSLVSQGVPKAQIKSRVEEAAGILRITDLLNSSVSGLSSGDRQRVALGRAIVRKPMAFLMDEPLGALDAEFREVMCHELRALHDRLHATTVVVTHDQTEAMSMADTIAIMNRGVIEQLGAPMEVYERPASVFVADFIGSPAMNFLPFEAALPEGAQTVQIGAAQVGVPALRQAVPHSDLLLGIRPEHVRLADNSALRAEVLGTEYLGISQIVTLTTALGATLRAKVHADAPVARGDHVGLDFEASAVSLFDKTSGKALKTARDDVAVAASRRGKPGGDAAPAGARHG